MIPREGGGLRRANAIPMEVPAVAGTQSVGG